jgi:curli biogenesis system outer membrane secretion channel CsgG
MFQKHLFLSLFFFYGFLFYSIGNHPPDVIQGILLSVEGERIFIDLNQDQVEIGDRLQVIKPDSFFTHAITGEKIPRVDEVIALLEIINVWPDYSEGRVFPSHAINNLEVGLEVSLMKENRRKGIYDSRKSIAVMPFDVSGCWGGYLGLYIADMLSRELFINSNLKVIDRETLGLQIDEIALTNMGVIKNRDAIKLGKENGIDYLITGIVYEADLIETTTGNSIKRIYYPGGSFLFQPPGPGLVSDGSISAQAMVNITLRILNVETGETLFIAAEMQQAEGKSQIELEQLALNGSKLNDGATTFLNTLAGQATMAALNKLTGYIEEFFQGKIDIQNYQGNIIKTDEFNERTLRNRGRNARIINLERSSFLKANNQQEYIAKIDGGGNTGYKKYATYTVNGPIYTKSPLTGEIRKTGQRKIAHFRIKQIDDNYALGNLIFGIPTPKIDISSFEEAEVSFYKIRSFFFSPLSLSTVLLGLDKGFYYPHIGYRFNGLLSLNTRIRGFVTGEKVDDSWWSSSNFYERKDHIFADFLLGFHYRPLRNFEVFANTGIAVPLKDSSYSLLLLDLGARIYFTNWLSIDFCVPVYPKQLILAGFSFHMF